MRLEPFLICPVCGEEAVIVVEMIENYLRYQGQCTSKDCEFYTQENTNYHRAIDFWNSMRAPEPAPAPEVVPEQEPASVMAPDEEPPGLAFEPDSEDFPRLALRLDDKWMDENDEEVPA